MSPRRPRIPSLVEHQKALVEAVAEGKEVGIIMPRRVRALIPVDRMTFVVEGHPVPKGRGIASVAPRGSKRKIIVRTPGQTKAYEEKVRWKARTAASRVRWKIGKADVYHLTIIVGRERAARSTGRSSGESARPSARSGGRPTKGSPRRL